MSTAIDKLVAFRDMCLLLKGQELIPTANGHISCVVTITHENIASILNADSLGIILSGCVQFKNDSLELSRYGQKLADSKAKVNLSLSMPKNAYQSWSALLSVKKNRLAIPDFFMIIDENFKIFSTRDDHPLVNSYRNIIVLIEQLKNIADHENGPGSLIFLGRSKLTIDINYNKNALETLNAAGLERLTEIMRSEEHITQKKLILQETLFNMLLQVNPNSRFEILLQRLQDLFIQFEHSYRFFITSFSFEEVRKEYEEKYREYNSKLNSSINDVATKALATPITMLFSISNITTSSTIISNYAIAISAILVSTFIIFLVQSNINNLSVIKDEYKNLFERLSSHLTIGDAITTGIENEIKGIIQRLDKRVIISENLNKITISSAIMSVIFIISYLFWINA